MSSNEKNNKPNDENQVETTGHSWDGIEELNNPLPKWWLYTFYATIAFSLLWFILYPAWPLVNKATSGVLGYSSRGAVEAELQAAEEAHAEINGRIVEASYTQIGGDDELRNYAAQGGKSVYDNNCAQCHQRNGAGAKGYPALGDDDWLWGGTYEDIEYSVVHGIRSEANLDTRISQMPAWGDILSREEIDQVVEQVRALSGLEHDQALADAGASIYQDNCASCHGDVGQGDRAQGAPVLNDAIWLHGEDREDIRHTIVTGANAVMPHWNETLSEAQIKQVVFYVHQLGGGE